MHAMTVDPAVGLLIVASVAVLFAATSYHKLSAPREFGEVVAAYRLLPAAMAVAAARVLPWVELALSVALLVPASRVLGCTAAALLLLTYAGAMEINLVRGRRDLDCGCAFARDRRPIAPWMVVRNGLIAAAVFLARPPWVGRALVPVDFLTIVGGCAALALLYVSIDALLGRIVPRAVLLRGR